MHFSLSKTFSRFRSVPDVSAVDHAPLHTRRPSSMSKIEELLNTACGSRERSVSRPRASSDSGLLSPKSSAVGYTPRRFSLLSPSLPIPSHESLKSHQAKDLLTLRTENRNLQNENTYLKLEAQVREEELNKFRSKYYTEKFNVAVQKHILGSNYQSRASQAVASSEVSLTHPVLHQSSPRRAGATIPILASAAKIKTTGLRSLSSRSTSTAVTSISPDDRLNLVNRERIARKLRDDSRATDFPTIRADDSRPSLLTPSPAISHSSTANTVLGWEERAMQMDDLLKQLKSGSAMFTPTSAVRPPTTVRTRVPVPLQDNKPYSRNLAPLASQVFKDEVKSSLSLAKRSPAKVLRSVLSDVDTNRIKEPRVRPQRSAENLGTQLSAKALGKRRAIILDHMLHPPQMDNNVPRALEPHHLPPLTPMGPATKALDDHGTFSAEKALLSLERICAGFSSGSLGSLDSGNDPSIQNDHLGGVPSLFVVDTTIGATKPLTVRSKTAPGPESPSFGWQSVKTSTPLISRLRPSLFPPSQFRPMATSSPKVPRSGGRPAQKRASPMRLTKAKGSGIHTPTPSPTKKPARRYTSPLRITMKGKLSTNASARQTPVRF
ncbi:hypothetical protein DXG01_003898 [Tephrocybe rancida]|nr:hypothetical protein DXG01_003898 [Tephrocybe rancida]